MKGRSLILNINKFEVTIPNYESILYNAKPFCYREQSLNSRKSNLQYIIENKKAYYATFSNLMRNYGKTGWQINYKNIVITRDRYA